MGSNQQAYLKTELGPVHMEVGDPGEAKVPHLPVVKKYLSSHAIPGTQGEVQNAIIWLIRRRINKELIVCSDLAAFRSQLEAKL